MRLPANLDRIALPQQQEMGSPDRSRNANRIVYVDPKGQLMTLDPERGEERQVSQPGRTYQFPAWSPDGSQIAAVGTDGQSVGVYVFSVVDGGDPISLYSSRQQTPFYLYWSPDSRWVSYLANDEAGLALRIADRYGNEEDRRLAQGQPFYWQWQKDGEGMLIHTGGASPQSSIRLLSVEAAEGDELARPGDFQAPGISPSGRYIAYASRISGRSQLVVATGDNERRWQTPHTGVLALTWSPVRDELAFMSPPSPAPHFYGQVQLMDAESGDIRVLGTRPAVAFFWSPDGDTIAYLSPTDQRNQPDLSWSLTRQVSAVSTAQSSPLRLDMMLLDVSSGEERRLASFQPTTLFLAQFLPFFDQYALSHRLWSPDSAALVLPQVDGDGGERIFVYPVDGQAPRDLAAGMAAFWSWQ